MSGPRIKKLDEVVLDVHDKNNLRHASAPAGTRERECHDYAAKLEWVLLAVFCELPMNHWLTTRTLLLLATMSPLAATGEDAKPIRVVVWDEQQPAQKQAYENFLGNAIADHLSKQPGITVRSMKLDDAEQGLSAEVLDFAEVLIWWGHVRQKEIKPELARKIVERIERGQLSLVALHSAHWSTPFMEAMNQRTRLDAAKRFPATNQKVEFEFLAPPQPYTLPAHGSLLTPANYATKRGGGLHVRVDLLPSRPRDIPGLQAAGAAQVSGERRAVVGGEELKCCRWFARTLSRWPSAKLGQGRWSFTNLLAATARLAELLA